MQKFLELRFRTMFIKDDKKVSNSEKYEKDKNYIVICEIKFHNRFFLYDLLQYRTCQNLVRKLKAFDMNSKMERYVQ